MPNYLIYLLVCKPLLYGITALTVFNFIYCEVMYYVDTFED